LNAFQVLDAHPDHADSFDHIVQLHHFQIVPRNTLELSSGAKGRPTRIIISLTEISPNLQESPINKEDTGSDAVPEDQGKVFRTSCHAGQPIWTGDRETIDSTKRAGT
jgi:hypothetical protein